MLVSLIFRKIFPARNKKREDRNEKRENGYYDKPEEKLKEKHIVAKIEIFIKKQTKKQ